jgi:hypothetical protein
MFMRLCGSHGCLVSSDYGLGSVGPGRHCAGLDPQDPLNFDIILSSLLLRWRGANTPHAGLSVPSDVSRYMGKRTVPQGVRAVSISRNLYESEANRKRAGQLRNLR